MKKILIIEDDAVVAKIYSDKLKAEGFAAEVAADGQAGFYRIHEIRPDGILLDLMLPGMNGVDILKKIRAQKQFRQIPVIVLSNAYVADMVQEAMEAGATLVLNKASTSPRRVVDALNECLFPLLPDEFVARSQPEPVLAPNSAPAAVSTEASFHAGSSRLQPEPTPVSAAAFSPTSNNGSANAVINGCDNLREAFLKGAPQILSGLRSACQAFLNATGETRLPRLFEMYRRVHSLTGNAGPAGFTEVADMASAFEALLKELHERPHHINASSLYTVARAMDFLGLLCERAEGQSSDTSAPLVLVVADEINSRRLLGRALERAQLRSINLDDPSLTPRFCEENRFDLILLEADLTGMNGFDLCEKIRESARNKTTPVVIVTNLTDFESRKQRALSGGNDLIAKPFLLAELAVKVLTYVLKGQVRSWQSLLGAV